MSETIVSAKDLYSGWIGSERAHRRSFVRVATFWSDYIFEGDLASFEVWFKYQDLRPFYKTIPRSTRRAQNHLLSKNHIGYIPGHIVILGGKVKVRKQLGFCEPGCKEKHIDNDANVSYSAAGVLTSRRNNF